MTTVSFCSRRPNLSTLGRRPTGLFQKISPKSKNGLCKLFDTSKKFEILFSRLGRFFDFFPKSVDRPDRPDQLFQNFCQVSKMDFEYFYTYQKSYKVHNRSTSHFRLRSRRFARR